MTNNNLNKAMFNSAVLISRNFSDIQTVVNDHLQIRYNLEISLNHDNRIIFLILTLHSLLNQIEQIEPPKLLVLEKLQLAILKAFQQVHFNPN